MASKRLVSAPNQPELTEAEGQEAFDRLKAVLAAVPPRQTTISAGAQSAAAFAASVARRDLEPPRLARFERLATTEAWDLASLTGLPDRANATWHCRRQQLQAMAVDKSNRTVPVSVVAASKTVRSRMLKVLQYHFEDDPVVGPKLQFVKSGAGYADLANDLQNLAELYAEAAVKTVIETDGRFYDGADVSTALELAGQIFDALGLQPDAPSDYWTHMTRAAFGLMRESYAELAAAGRFLFRRSENVEQTYPSLFAAGRKPRRPRRAADPAPSEDGPAAEPPDEASS